MRIVKIHSEPLWIPQSRLVRSDIPSTVLDWLLDEASLTKRLQSVCRGRFRVRVLSQGWARPMVNEAQVLGLHPYKYAMVRQVELLCDETPWVYARTIIPRKTLKGRLRRLAHLQSQSLGAVLFASPTMRRGEVEIANILVNSTVHKLFEDQGGHLPESAWARRSVFHLYEKPLLVSEIFLPAMEELHF